MKTATRNFSSFTFFLASFFASILISIPSFAQYQNQQEEKQKTPIEIAAEQADKLQKDFKLTDGQTFLIDSVLQTNMTGVFDDFDKMKKGGVQSSESYKATQEMWMKRTEDAFRKIMTAEQFLRYEKMTGLYAKRKKEEKEKAKLEVEKAKQLQKNK